MGAISLLKFKKECLALLENLDSAGILITNRGKPRSVSHAYGIRLRRVDRQYEGKIKIHGDILSTQMNWVGES